jgi:hypothetical protein
VIIEGVSIALGFVFYGLIDVKVHLIWTSFAILPAVAASFLLFYGNWKSNDYFFYENGGKKPEEKNVNAIEPVSNMSQDNSGIQL